MKNLILLPSWSKYLGYLMVLPCLVMFLMDPEIVFGEDSFFIGKESNSIFYRTVPALFDSADEGEFRLIGFVKNDLSNELLLSIMLIGSFLIAFAKVKDEDEFIHQLRLEAMAQSIFINSIILFELNWLIYDGLFLYVLIIQLFSFLLLYNIVFMMKIRKQRKMLGHEE